MALGTSFNGNYRCQNIQVNNLLVVKLFLASKLHPFGEYDYNVKNLLENYAVSSDPWSPSNGQQTTTYTYPLKNYDDAFGPFGLNNYGGGGDPSKDGPPTQASDFYDGYNN
jgi:hypothetical protein